MKTTNAKTTAFQTPAPLSGSVSKTQKLSPRLRRPKVKIHQPEAVQDEQEEREIEYMPPKEIPLPDNLDEDMPEIDWDFPQFKGKNFTRGALSTYMNPVGDDGLTKGQREEMESLAKQKKEADKEMERIFAEINAKEEAELCKRFGISELPSKSLSKPDSKAPATKLKPQRSGPSTIASRSAAAALSPPAKPSYLAPTRSTNSKLPSSRTLFSARTPVSTTKPIPNPSAARHAAASTASKSTIGYGHRRAVSSALPRKPLSNVTNPIIPRPTLATRKPTLSSTSRTHSRPSSRPSSRDAPASAIHPRTRAPFSRTSSAATDKTLVASTADQVSESEIGYPEEEALEQELRLLALRTEAEDDAEMDAWMNGFMGEPANIGLVDEELEDFQFKVPEELE